jgi:hypothetical protein
VSKKTSNIPSVSFHNQSASQLEAHIKRVSKDTASVVFTVHSQVRMKERAISINVVFDVLRFGRIIRSPEPNSSKGSIECRMERFVVGALRCVVVALSDSDPNLIVVTAF